MLNIIYKIVIAIASLYLVIIGLLFFFQEKLIFFPSKISKSYQFKFGGIHQEINIPSNDGAVLNGILFKAENSKGLIFYLHGNGGTIDSWGTIAPVYTNLNYDLFILDYRSYGKSEGTIQSEKQLFNDHQLVYNHLKTMYDENKIIVLGYSIGTGFAAKLASENNPKLLILQAPYFNLTDIMRKNYPFVPTFLLKYKLKTNEYLKACKLPIVIFHGTADEIIYYQSSIKLYEENKLNAELISLPKQVHIGISDNPLYVSELKKILSDLN